MIWAVALGLVAGFAIFGLLGWRLVAGAAWLGLLVLVLRDASGSAAETADSLAFLGAGVMLALWGAILCLPLLGYGLGYGLRASRRRGQE